MHTPQSTCLTAPNRHVEAGDSVSALLELLRGGLEAFRPLGVRGVAGVHGGGVVGVLAHHGGGAGGDQLILLEPSASADLKMRIYNADGSEVTPTVVDAATSEVASVLGLAAEKSA